MLEFPSPRRKPAASARRSAGLAAGVLLLGALFLAGNVRADKGGNEGDFKDREGKAHHWSIQRSHLLEWEGKLFVPAGVVFRSAYLQAPSPTTLQEDTTELDRLRAAGVHDLWIEPGRSLLDGTPEQTQQVIDLVDAHGFTYGLRVGGRSRE